MAGRREYGQVRPMLLCLLMVVALSGCAPRAGEQYPTRPIDVISPWAAGGPVELPARVVLEALREKWGQPLNVVNKPGGNTVPGTLAMMQAKPDGYTLMIDTNGSSSVQALMPDLPFKLEDRTFVCSITSGPMAFFVKGDSPWKDLRDVAAAAKQDPASFSWSSYGGTALAELCLRQFFADAGIDVAKTKPVVFKGGAESSAAVAGGHVSLGCCGVSLILSYAEAGTLRIVGVSGEVRAPGLPEVPTAVEQGFPSVTITQWVGFTGPPGLPASVVSRWAQDVQAVLKDPNIIARLQNLGVQPCFRGPDDFRSYVLTEAERIRKLVKPVGGQ